MKNHIAIFSQIVEQLFSLDILDLFLSLVLFVKYFQYWKLKNESYMDVLMVKWLSYQPVSYQHLDIHVLRSVFLKKSYLLQKVLVMMKRLDLLGISCFVDLGVVYEMKIKDQMNTYRFVTFSRSHTYFIWFVNATWYQAKIQ
ncbi:unnamed protein product [Heterobilharzia americana]|nr:unnamed protein product [Heterobilharzia americana]